MSNTVLTIALCSMRASQRFLIGPVEVLERGLPQRGGSLSFAAAST